MARGRGRMIVALTVIGCLLTAAPAAADVLCIDDSPAPHGFHFSAFGGGSQIVFWIAGRLPHGGAEVHDWDVRQGVHISSRGPRIESRWRTGRLNLRFVPNGRVVRGQRYGVMRGVVAVDHVSRFQGRFRARLVRGNGCLPKGGPGADPHLPGGNKAVLAPYDISSGYLMGRHGQLFEAGLRRNARSSYFAVSSWWWRAPHGRVREIVSVATPAPAKNFIAQDDFSAATVTGYGPFHGSATYRRVEDRSFPVTPDEPGTVGTGGLNGSMSVRFRLGGGDRINPAGVWRLGLRLR